MEQTTNARLRSQDIGAIPTLIVGDLLFAHIFPPSRGVHVVKLLVGDDGHAEYGEYVIPPREAQQFFHGRVRVAPDDLTRLRAALADLCAARQTIDFEEDDGEEYEEPTRRLLRHGCEGKDVFSVSPTAEFYEDYEIKDSARKAYQKSFESAWQITNNLIELGRGAAREGD